MLYLRFIKYIYLFIIYTKSGYSVKRYAWPYIKKNKHVDYL